MSVLIYAATSALIFGCASYVSFRMDKYDSTLFFGALSLTGAILVWMGI